MSEVTETLARYDVARALYDIGDPRRLAALQAVTDAFTRMQAARGTVTC